MISFFYYRRAGWNIVERKLAFPDEPLPDPAFLRKDFETCVLQVNNKVKGRKINFHFFIFSKIFNPI